MTLLGGFQWGNGGFFVRAVYTDRFVGGEGTVVYLWLEFSPLGILQGKSCIHDVLWCVFTIVVIFLS
jgi:hypothetical protein